MRECFGRCTHVRRAHVTTATAIDYSYVPWVWWLCAGRASCSSSHHLSAPRAMEPTGPRRADLPATGTSACCGSPPRRCPTRSRATRYSVASTHVTRLRGGSGGAEERRGDERRGGSSTFCASIRRRAASTPSQHLPMMWRTLRSILLAVSKRRAISVMRLISSCWRFCTAGFERRRTFANAWSMSMRMRTLRQWGESCV